MSSTIRMWAAHLQLDGHTDLAVCIVTFVKALGLPLFPFFLITVVVFTISTEGWQFYLVLDKSDEK